MREKFAVVSRLFFIFLLFLFTSILFSCKKSDDRNQVVLYCSVDQELAEPIIAVFKAVSMYLFVLTPRQARR
jgi:hypothetical protein